jgi:uncharacterized membrane protein YfcA
VIYNIAVLALTLFLGAVGIGFVSAIAGIGGGSLMVPFMVLLLGYDVKIAVATSLLSIVVTSASSASVYLRRGMVDVRTALILEPATAVGAVIGAYTTLTLSKALVQVLLGALLLATAVATYLKGYLRREDNACKNNSTSVLRRVSAVASSSIAGLASGMFGIGGGVLKVPIMNLILDLPIKTAVATSLFMIGLTASSGSMVYLLHGVPDPLSVAALASGLIPGATLGAKYMRRLKPSIVRAVFSVILAYAGLKLMLPYF